MPVIEVSEEIPRDGGWSHDDWFAEGKRLFGEDVLNWKSKCPSCGNVTTVKAYKDAGAKHGDSAFFNCIGRYLGKRASDIGGKPPCNYTSGGLFVLNTRFIVVDGKRMPVFEFGEST